MESWQKGEKVILENWLWLAACDRNQQ